MQLIKVFLCVWVAGMFVLPLSAAAWSDVGLVDYYRVSKIRGMPIHEKINTILNSDIPPKVELKRLIGKCAPSEQVPIAVGDCFSINLSTALIGKFPEWGLKGEVAIVARVSERKEGSLEFGSDAANSGRVIYFGNDVRQRQQLNFSYLPIYGPMNYTGRPVDVQLYIIEIDDADQFKPLLKTLANVGMGLYPPAAPVLKVLDSIGGALLSATRDDNMLEYSFCLNARMPNLEKTYAFDYGEYPVFEAGHYVIMRRQNRKDDMRAVVKDVYYDPYAQSLKWYDSNTKTAVPYREDSYLILHVKRELSTSALDSDNRFYKTFAELRNEEKQKSATYVQRIQEDLHSLADGLARENKVKGLYGLYERVSTATAEKAAIAKLDASALIFGIEEEIKDREACPEGEACLTVPTRRELMELLVLMRATSAFSGVADNLTYEVLKTHDVARNTQMLDTIEIKIKTIQQ